MPSDADAFVDNLDSFKEFSDDTGGHYFIMKFDDDSGRVLQKQPSEDSYAVAEFEICERSGKDAMRRISEATGFEFDETANTQQNFRHLMQEL